MCKMPCFRERLNQLFINSGKTIVDFAKTLGPSRQSLGYYLNGERIPDAHTVKQICERCNVSADWLLGLSDVESPDTDMQAVCKYLGLSEETVSFLRMISVQLHDQFITMLIDALFDNDNSRASFIMSLKAIYQAYKIKKENENSSIPESIPEINDKNSKSFALYKKQDINVQIDFEKYLSNRAMTEALEALFHSDALLALYQKEAAQEGSENGQS